MSGPFNPTVRYKDARVYLENENDVWCLLTMYDSQTPVGKMLLPSGHIDLMKRGTTEILVTLTLNDFRNLNAEIAKIYGGSDWEEN